MTETVFGLPACNAGDPDTYALHDAIYEALRRWPQGCFPGGYEYRTDYLPDYVTGNDVVALTVITSESARAGLDVPAVLRPLLEHDTGRPATSDDVTYVADNAADLAKAVKHVARVMRGEVRGWVRAAKFAAWGVFIVGLVWGIAAAMRERDEDAIREAIDEADEEEAIEIAAEILAVEALS